ncbi:MAG: type II secretion system F family protein [Planctomycetota bacterium]
MPVVEHNLLTDSPPRQAQTAGEASRSAVEVKADRRDIFQRIRTRQLCRFTRQLATLLRAGMPLVPALSALAEQLHETTEATTAVLRTQSHRLAEIVKQVAERVNAGSTLAAALAKHPDVFSNLFVSMVAAGQAGGSLEEVLFRLAEMLENRVRLATKVKSAIAYPLMMTVVATGVVVFLLSFVVPSITQIFLEMNRALPWPTRLLVWLSTFIKDYFLAIAIAGCAICCGIAAGIRTKDGKLLADRYKIGLPLFGALLLKLEIARLARTLGTLVSSGAPILDALKIAKGVIQNSFIAGSLESVKDSVSRGDDIANAIKRTGLFPPVVYHIMATGQISGDIEKGLLDIADMYDSEVELTAKTLTALLEPAILLVMGVVVGFIVLAILLPIFEINQVF